VKTTGILSVLAFATMAWGQAAPPANQPIVQIQGRKASTANAPTPSDLYCGGFIASQKVPSNRYVTGGWNSPDQTRYASQSVDVLYIHGRDIKEGDRLSIIRHAQDPNHYEYFPGQNAAVKSLGEVYFEMGYVKVINVQRETAVAVPELACADFVVGDVAVPFEERTAPPFRVVSLDRYAPPSGKPQGRIIMGHEFDGYLGAKSVGVVNIGEDKGLKVGDYLRVTRTYSRTYRDPEAGLAMHATANEDTQADSYNPAKIDVASLPLRTLGDMIVLEVRKKSATAMVVTSLQEIEVGDGVELMDTSSAPEVAPLQPAWAAEPPSAANTAPAVDSVPQISCSASPATLRPGETATISCDATSPDNRPLNITFVTNAGKLSSSRNQAKLDTTDVGPGPIAVRATAFDDRQLSASATTTVNVEAPPTPQAAPQKMTDLDFKPTSAYVDNRSKAVLDDVALKMQQDPTSTAVLVGSADEKEPPRIASQRAENAKTYLTASKGIDAQRLQTRTSKTPGRGVQIWTLPAGTSLPQ
jgi:outer membrane protein OmpA-like peptidoglycan-associated protein